MSAFEYSTTGMILESVEYKQFKLRLKSDSNRRKYLNWVNQGPHVIVIRENVLRQVKIMDRTDEDIEKSFWDETSENVKDFIVLGTRTLIWTSRVYKLYNEC